MKRILVVDDMAVFREPIALSLRANGYEVITAGDGQEALRLLQSQPADLVLLDIAMPVMDGLEFLRVIRRSERFANLPVVLLTAVAEKDYVVKAARLGAREYLLKSNFALSDLLARVESSLQAKASNAQTSGPVATQGNKTANTPPPTPETDKDPTSFANKMTAMDATQQPPSTLKDLKPLLSRSEVEDRIEAVGELKALSPTVAQLMKLTGHKDCSVEQAAKVIKQDHALSLKVLKLANSSVYTRGEPVETVHNAVMRIGLSQIRQLAMSICVIDSFSTDHERVEQWINTYAFWEHSIAVGLLAAKLAHQLELPDEDVDMMFTTGLLHDVGRMVYIEQFGEKYVEVLNTADMLCLPLERVEKRMLLVDHADVMDRLLHTWCFAKHLINPIALHHLSVNNIRGIAPKSLTEVCILSLANRLAHAMLLGSSGNNTIYSTAEFASALKINDRQFDAILESVPDETQDLKLLMLQSGARDAWPQRRQQVRDAIGQPVRPIFASPKPATDAYRVFVDALAEQDPEDKPNLAVLRLESVRDRDTVSSMLQRSEADAEISELPLLIISPKGDLTLDDKQMKGRAVRLLPAPTPISLFCKAAGELLIGSYDGVEPRHAA